MLNGRFNLKLWATAAVFAAGGLVGTAQPAPDSGLFSKPADAGVSAPEDSVNLPPDNSSGNLLIRHDATSALPSPSPDLTPELQKQMRQQAEWTLMTPEQIMGVQTPEEIFGLKAEDQDENASPEELYLKREEKAKAAPAPDSMFETGDWSHDNASRFDRPDGRDPLSKPQDQTDPGAFSRMFNNSEASPFVRNGAAMSGNLPRMVSTDEKAQQDQAQAAEMERFRTLIGEVPPAPDPALTARPLDARPAMQPFSPFDEFGHPAVANSIDPSKPESVSLPSEITGYSPPPVKTKKPSWEPQTPPWLSDGVTPPSKPPVRKF